MDLPVTGLAASQADPVHRQLCRFMDKRTATIRFTQPDSEYRSLEFARSPSRETQQLLEWPKCLILWNQFITSRAVGTLAGIRANRGFPAHNALWINDATTNAGIAILQGF
jgi:hypothetical protein